MTRPDYTLTSEQVRTLLDLALIAEDYIEEVRQKHLTSYGDTTRTNRLVLEMYRDDRELATVCVKLLDGLVHGE